MNGLVFLFVLVFEGINTSHQSIDLPTFLSNISHQVSVLEGNDCLVCFLNFKGHEDISHLNAVFEGTKGKQRMVYDEHSGNFPQYSKKCGLVFIFLDRIVRMIYLNNFFIFFLF